MEDNINQQFLKKIHEGIDSKSHIAITKNWDPSNDFMVFPDKSYFYDQLFEDEAFYTYAESVIDREEDDVYFSINSFRGRKKVEEDVWHLNAFALDFDYYKIKEYENYTAEEMYEILKNKLPVMPTAAVDSGRGLYIIYTFKHCPRQMLRTYKSLYKTFFKLLDGYGMDPRAMNVTQIIRLPGTYNSKSKTEVKVLELNDTNYKIKDFYELFPYTRDEVREYRENKIEKRNQQSIYEYVDDEHTKFSSARKRVALEFFEDFERLIKLRNERNIREGYRETLIYLVRRYCRWYGANYDEEMSRANKYNNMFLEPLDEKEFLYCTKPAGNTKKPGIKWMIQKLGVDGITHEEQQQLKKIKSKNLKDKLYQKSKRKIKLLNITHKQQQVLERRTRVIALKREGKRNKHIADVLGIDKSTVTRDLQYISKNAWQFKKKLKAVMDELTSKLNTSIFRRHTRYKEQKQLLEWLKISEVMLN